MAKYTLINTDDLYNFVLLGIASMENQYVLVSQINSALQLDLCLNENIKVSVKNGEIFEFSVYGFTQEEMAMEYLLIPNKSNNRLNKPNKQNQDLFELLNERMEEVAWLVPELPKTDYFVILKGENAIHEQHQIIKLLKEAAAVQQLHEIIPDKLPSRNNLVF